VSRGWLAGWLLGLADLWGAIHLLSPPCPTQHSPEKEKEPKLNGEGCVTDLRVETDT